MNTHAYVCWLAALLVSEFPREKGGGVLLTEEIFSGGGDYNNAKNSILRHDLKLWIFTRYIVDLI